MLWFEVRGRSRSNVLTYTVSREVYKSTIVNSLVSVTMSSWWMDMSVVLVVAKNMHRDSGFVGQHCLSHSGCQADLSGSTTSKLERWIGSSLEWTLCLPQDPHTLVYRY